MPFVEPTKFSWVVDENGKKRKKAARDTSWRARYIDPSGRARGKTFPRKYDAEQFLAQNTTSIQHGDWADPALRRTRFSEWADVWWATTPKLAPSTRRGYERMLRIYIRPVFDDRPIASIDWNEVELFIAKLVNEKLSPKTVRHAVSILTLVMQTAMRSKAIRENPAVGHTINIPRTRPNVLTMEQVHSLVDHTDERYQPVVWLLVLAGLRSSELCGLRPCDVDWERHAITINEVQMQVRGELVVKGPKTNSGVRTIPLPEWLFDDLRISIERRSAFDPQSTDRIFTTITGKPLADHTLWKIIDKSRRSAGLPTFRPYDLRHSHASLLIELGAHPKAISERMGHSEIGVTMNVYGHLFQGAQAKLTSDLDGLVSKTRRTERDDPTSSG